MVWVFQRYQSFIGGDLSSPRTWRWMPLFLWFFISTSDFRWRLSIDQIHRDQKFSRDQPFQIRLWDQRFWIASSANATPCHLYTRHCIWESMDVKEYRTFTKQQRQLLRKLSSTNLFGTILFEMNNWQYSHLSPQPSRRVVIRPGNYTWLASVVD